MQNILRVIELKKELDSLRPLNKDQEEKIMQKFRLDWNYHSNHLEGNSLTFGETKNLILHGITAHGKPLKDHFEITGHNEALNWIIDIVKEERPLTENFIRELHTLLLKEPYEVDAETPDGKPTKKRIEVGKYKSSQNHVKTATGEIFRFAEPEETPAKMHDLLEWYKNKKEEKELNPTLLASEFHYKFIIIHPFDDGNGRMARVLMNFIFMTFHYPPVIIKTEDKNNYFFALRQADTGDIEFFIDYIAKNLVRSLEIMIAGAKGENIEEPDDIDKNIALLEHKLKGIGDKASVVKSNLSLKDFIEKTIIPLLNKFITKVEKFDKFYTKNSISILFYSDDLSILELPKNKIKVEYLQSRIKDSLTRLTFTYNFEGFNNTNLPEFNYKSTLDFIFHITKLEITIGNVKYTKLYTETLNDLEVKKIIDEEIKFHSQFIEQEIQKSELGKNNSKK